MAAVADAVLLAGQQPVHHLFVGVGGLVVEERFLFGGRGRDADQVEVNAAQQRALIRWATGSSPGPVFGGDEGIDGVCGFGC